MVKVMLKGIVLLLITAFALCSIETAFAEVSDKYEIIVNNSLPPSNIHITVQNGLSYVPLIPLQKSLALTVAADGGNIIVKNDRYLISIYPGGNMIIDGQQAGTQLPFIINEKEVYAPILFITDILGYKTELLDEINCIRIITTNNVLTSAQLISRVKLAKNISAVTRNTKIAYLTFDDGIDRKITVQVLDVLKEYNVKATFFIIGNTIDRNKDIFKRILAEGHSIGNHTYTHKLDSIYKNADSLIEELKKTNEKFKNAAGISTKLFRPPYGLPYIRRQDLKAALAGYKVISWNVDSMDSRIRGIKSEKIASYAINQAKNKKCAVILFHCSATHSETVKALPKVIEYLIDNGFVFSTINESTVLHYYGK